MNAPKPSRWQAYYEATHNRPPHATAARALELFAGEPDPGRRRLAVDLGCGEGRDAVAMLRAGWQVFALDTDPGGLKRLLERVSKEESDRLWVECGAIEETAWPACDLVNASFSLMMIDPRQFPQVWARIVASLSPGGRFAGQVLGPFDDWAADPAVSRVTEPELDSLFAGFAFEMREEVHREGTTAKGSPKHWHLFEIVARKR